MIELSTYHVAGALQGGVWMSGTPLFIGSAGDSCRRSGLPSRVTSELV